MDEDTNWTINTQDRLSPDLTNSPPKKKPCTRQRIVIMEGGDEDMDTNVIT
jgi:hypothetical protein